MPFSYPVYQARTKLADAIFEHYFNHHPIDPRCKVRANVLTTKEYLFIEVNWGSILDEEITNDMNITPDEFLKKHMLRLKLLQPSEDLT